MIGIGTDMVEIERFRATLARTPRIVDRLFTTAEQAYATRRNDPTERYAARFAAKEAVLKALGLGIGDMAFTDIEVVRAESGQPAVLLHGAALALAEGRGVRRWLLTMTHTDQAAQAIAVALGDDAP